MGNTVFLTSDDFCDMTKIETYNFFAMNAECKHMWDWDILISKFPEIKDTILTAHGEGKQHIDINFGIYDSIYWG
jgi:hypothetical protein